ncbi:MAG: hypothetical protein CVT89_00970, partial [Candidatus Altiarchaeales archaeon HGW-Altiarchaeales-2]
MQEFLTFYVGYVDNSSPKSFTYNVTVTSGANEGMNNNTVIVSGYDGLGRTIPKEVKQANVSVIIPKISVNKTANVSQAQPGDLIKFTLNITTTGNVYDVNVTDILPDNFELILPTQPNYTGKDGNILKFNIPNINGQYLINITLKATSKSQTSSNVFFAEGIYGDNKRIISEDANVWLTIVNPQLDVVKEITGVVLNGDMLTTAYKVTIKNVGQGTAYDVLFKDTLQQGNNYVTGTFNVNGTLQNPNPANNILTYSVGNLQQGQEVNITYNCSGNLSDSSPSGLQGGINLVTVNASDGYKEISAQATASTGALSVSKTKNKDIIEAGEGMTFTVTLNAVTDLTNVVVSDTLPSDWSYVTNSATLDGSSSGFTVVSTSPLTINISTLSQGTHTLKYNATAGCNALKQDMNKVIVNYTYNNGNIEYNFTSKPVSVIVNVKGKPILVLDKKANATYAEPGDVIRYSINISNLGESKILNLNISDKLPVGFNYISGSSKLDGSSIGDPTLTGQILNWTSIIGVLNPGESKLLTFNVSVTSTADVYSLNTVNATGISNCLELVNKAEVPVEVRKPELDIQKSVDPKFATIGDTIYYTVSITNNGKGKAYNVIANDTHLSGFNFVNSTCVNVLDCDPTVSGNTLTWNVGTLEPGQTAVILYSMYVNSSAANGTNINNILLSYDDKSGTTNTNYDNETVHINVGCVLNLTKEVISISPSPGSNKAEIGSTVTYKWTVTKIGDCDDIRYVVLTDNIPNGGDNFVNKTCDATINNNVITWNIG